MNNAEKRRKKYVDRQVQGALVRRLAVHWFAFLVLAIVLSFILQFLRNPSTSPYEHWTQLLRNNGGFLLMTICFTPVFLYDSIKLSHKFVGPVLRLGQSLRDLSDGNHVESMKLRPDDYWQEIIGDFNAILPRFQAEEDPSKSAASDKPTDRELTSMVGQES